MMTELDKTAHLVKTMVNAVKLPITAKMRLGWEGNNITAPDLVRVLEDVAGGDFHSRGDTRTGFHRDGESRGHPPRGSRRHRISR
ncbi:MAG: hypothetical protein Ct9H300mP7_4040 [Verrucomicrobiota bacterium]|nr:MAG: hypothetical protein Ct9H300mP7_4040 [Verrucomicrobiota bacterium]